MEAFSFNLCPNWKASMGVILTFILTFSFNLCPIWKASMGVIITGGRDFKRLLGSSRGLFVYLSTEYTHIYICSEELVLIMSVVQNVYNNV